MNQSDPAQPPTHPPADPPAHPPTASASESSQKTPLVNTRRHSLPNPKAEGVMVGNLPKDLQKLLRELDRIQGPISVEVLEDKLAELTFTVDDIADFATFDDQNYRRNLLHEGVNYHALLLCWKSGQRSPIHDHRGSACGVRIIQGSAMETVFQQTPEGHLYPTISQELGPGLVCASYDMDIHQISNLQEEGQPLVTLHIYSPPLHVMGTYSLTSSQSGEFSDPIHFIDGAGI